MKNKFLCLSLVVLLVFASFAIAQDTNQAQGKIARALHAKTDSSEMTSVLVQFTQDPKNTQKILLEINGCRIKYKSLQMNLLIADCPGNKILDVASDEEIKFIYDDEILSVELSDTVPQISAPAAWVLGYNGTGINISVIDTGMNSSHPALQGQIVLEHDFTTDGTTDDLSGHGTNVVGAIASLNETYKGAAPGAKIFNAKAGNNLGLFSSSAVIAAIDWSILNGAQVISASFGGAIGLSCSESPTANYMNDTAKNNNIPIIVGAGNGGPGSSTIYTPACAQNVVAVGGVDKSNIIYDKSSRGPTVVDGFPKPEIVAPAVSVISTTSTGGFSAGTGTSIATPHVSAVVAIMKQAYPDLSWSDTTKILQDSATDLGYDYNTQGAGLVNASKALNLTLEFKDNMTAPSVIDLGPIAESTYDLLENIEIKANVTDNRLVNNVKANITYPNGTVALLTLSNAVGDKYNASFAIPDLNGRYNITILADDMDGNSNNSEKTYFFVRRIESSGLLAYYTSTSSDQIKARNISSDASISNQDNSLSIGAGAGAVWLKTAASPQRDEEILVSLDNLSDVNVQIRNASGYHDLKELTINTGGFNERRFDVAYEQQSGRAIIIYANNTANPAYEIWDGMTYESSGNLPATSCTGSVTWIAAASKPNSNELIVMYIDASGNYCAQVWNGTGWGNAKNFGSDTGVATQKFGISYEQQSGQALAVYETSTAGVLGYCAWDGTNWCSSGSTLADRGGQNDWVMTASEPYSDRILIGAIQGDADVDVIEWNGTTFGTWKQIDASIESTNGVNRVMDVAYIGMTGKGLIVYDDANVDVPSYATCADASACYSGTWSSVNTTTSTSNNCGEAADLDYIGLAEDLITNSTLMYALSQTSHYKCAQIYNATNGWLTWNSNLGSGQASTSGEEISGAYALKNYII